MKHSKEYYVNGMKPVGKFLYYSKAARFWADGDGSSFTWNYWNPIAWLLILILVPLVILIGGLHELKSNGPSYGFGLTKYWRARKNEREFY